MLSDFSLLQHVAMSVCHCSSLGFILWWKAWHRLHLAGGTERFGLTVVESWHVLISLDSCFVNAFGHLARDLVPWTVAVKSHLPYTLAWSLPHHIREAITVQSVWMIQGFLRVVAVFWSVKQLFARVLAQTLDLQLGFSFLQQSTGPGVTL